MMANAIAKQVEVVDGDRRMAPGDFYFVWHGGEDENTAPAGMIHACPCGCGGRGVLWFRGRGQGRQEWDVAGEWPKVTLSPSIGMRFDGEGKKSPEGSFHWHGWLRDGVFEEG